MKHLGYIVDDKLQGSRHVGSHRDHICKFILCVDCRERRREIPLCKNIEALHDLVERYRDTVGNPLAQRNCESDGDPNNDHDDNREYDNDDRKDI